MKTRQVSLHENFLKSSINSFPQILTSSAGILASKERASMNNTTQEPEEKGEKAKNRKGDLMNVADLNPNQ